MVLNNTLPFHKTLKNISTGYKFHKNFLNLGESQSRGNATFP